MCVRPISVKVISRTFGLTRYVDAPCGTCIECLKRRQNDWKLRLCHESNYWNHVYFFTLTYSNDSLPCHVYYHDCLTEPLLSGTYSEVYEFACDNDLLICSTACKKDVQNWFKRMREDISRSIGSRMKCKYFICAEYGPNPNGTKRPHYHGLLLTDCEYNLVRPHFDWWHNNKGRIDFQEVGINRSDKSSVANYVSKYCVKGCFESRSEDISLGRIESAFSLISKNIGERWIEANKHQWLQYVPHSLQVDGDFSHKDIELFFASGTDKSVMLSKEIDSLIDNLFVFDGDEKLYKYQLPRYYRERVFQIRKTFNNYDTTSKPTLRLCQSQLQSFSEVFNERGRCKAYCLSHFPKPITYEVMVRKDTRYVSENFLSAAIAYRLYCRSVNNDRRKFEIFCEQNSGRSYDWLCREYSLDKVASKFYREKSAQTKLINFYNSNMFKNVIFDN